MHIVVCSMFVVVCTAEGGAKHYVSKTIKKINEAETGKERLSPLIGDRWTCRKVTENSRKKCKETVW